MINSEMTREEAILKLQMCYPNQSAETRKSMALFVGQLEALNIVKFKTEPKVKNLTHFVYKDYGSIRLEEWPEGLVLWVGSEIVYKSWSSK